MTPSTRRGSSLGAILGVALVTGTLVLAANLDEFEKDGAFEKDDTGVGGFELPPNAPPMAGGEKVNLDQAARLLAVPFYRPDTDLASDASLGDIWISEDKDLELYVRYMSGVTLKVRPAEGSWSNEECSRLGRRRPRGEHRDDSRPRCLHRSSGSAESWKRPPLRKWCLGDAHRRGGFLYRRAENTCRICLDGCCKGSAGEAGTLGVIKSVISPVTAVFHQLANSQQGSAAPAALSIDKGSGQLRLEQKAETATPRRRANAPCGHVLLSRRRS